jgi:hypothetical protein
MKTLFKPYLELAFSPIDFVQIKRLRPGRRWSGGWRPAESAGRLRGQNWRLGLLTSR